MQAIVLAAGEGKRLGKYTENNTKCMLEINGKKIIEKTLENLNSCGIKKVILVVGYQKDSLINYLGSHYKDTKLEYIENPIYNSTNNIYSLYLAKEALAQDDTLLIESDLLFERSIVKALLDDPRESLVTVDKFQLWMDGTSVSLDEKDTILKFHSKAKFDFKAVETYYKTVNIYKFSKAFSSKVYLPFLEAYIQVVGHQDYYESALSVLTVLDNHSLQAFKLTDQKWYEVDDIQDKKNAEIIFAPNAGTKLQRLNKRYGG